MQYIVSGSLDRDWTEPLEILNIEARNAFEAAAQYANWFRHFLLSHMKGQEKWMTMKVSGGIPSGWNAEERTFQTASIDVIYIIGTQGFDVQYLESDEYVVQRDILCWNEEEQDFLLIKQSKHYQNGKEVQI